MRAMTVWIATAIALCLISAAAGGFIARRVWIDDRIAGLTAAPKAKFTEGNAALPPKAGRLRVVLIGDSSFARWPKAALNERWQFVNRGVGGETTAQIAQRFDTDALALSPDVIVLWAGINDLVAAEFLDPASRRAAIDTTYRTLADLARRGADREARVIIATIAPPSRPELMRLPVWREPVRDSVAEVNRRIRQFTAQSGVDLVDFAAALDSGDRRTPDAYRVDALHLNAAGYARLAKALDHALEH